MKIIVTLLALLWSASAFSDNGITICHGQFALCAASACKPTGGTITNQAGESFPEVECTCPILYGDNIADLSAGNMTSCEPTDENSVWSTFWPRADYPRQQNDFSHNPEKMRGNIVECPASLKQGHRASNCFSWNCKIDKNGLAVCSCPMGQEPPETAFLIESTMEGTQRCSEHPVSLPLVSQMFERSQQLK
jgi:hypothetical protein